MMSKTKYDLDRFVPSPDTELICNICQSVFCEPTETPCRHVFCKLCIITWLNNQQTCPTCRKQTTRASLKPVLPLIQNMINKLTVKCEHFDQGCQTIVLVELYGSHLKECLWEMITCDNILCFNKMLRKDLKTHKKKCKHRLVKCQEDCHLEIPKLNLRNHNCLQELKKKVLALQANLKKASDEKSDLKRQIVQLEKNLKDTQQNPRRRRLSISTLSEDSLGSNWTDAYSSLFEDPFEFEQSQAAEGTQSINNMWNWDLSIPSRTPSRRAISQRRANTIDLTPLLSTASLLSGNTPDLSTYLASSRISTDSDTSQAVGNSQAETRDTNNNTPNISSIITLLQQLLNRAPSGIEENQALQPVPSSTFTQCETEATAVMESAGETASEMQEIVLSNDSGTIINLSAGETDNNALNLDDRGLNSLTSLGESSGEESIQSIRTEPSNDTVEVEILNDTSVTTKRRNSVITTLSNLKSGELFEDRSMTSKLPRKGHKYVSHEAAPSIDTKPKKKTIAKFSQGINKSVDWLSKNNRYNPEAENEKSAFKRVNKLKRKNPVEIGDNSLPGTSGINYEQNLRGQSEEAAINSKLKNIQSAKFQLKLSGFIPSDHSSVKKSRSDNLQISNECILQSNVKPKKKKKIGHKINSLVIKPQDLVCNGMSKITDSNVFTSQSEPISGILATSMLNNMSKSSETLQSKSLFELNISETNKNLFPRGVYNNYLTNNYKQQTHLENESSTVLNWSSSDETLYPDCLSDITSSEDTMTESDYEIRIPKSTTQLLQEYVSNESDESWHPW